MDRKLVSAEDHEIEYLARKHRTTKAKVLEIAHATGSRSRSKSRRRWTSGSSTSTAAARDPTASVVRQIKNSPSIPQHDATALGFVAQWLGGVLSGEGKAGR